MDLCIAANFQLLWIMLLKNTGVQICVWTLFSTLWGIHPKWNHWIVWQMYFFIFEETPYCIHSCFPILHSYSQCRRVHKQHLSKNKTVQRSIWLVQECRGVCRTSVLFRVSWLFECLLLIKMLNLDFGTSGVEAPLTIAGGHWVSLVLQSCVGRRHFMPQSSRKHSPVISDSEWRLVPPPSRQLEATIVWCFDWAGLESVPPLKCHLILPQSRVPIPCHSENNETESVQVSGSLVKGSAESERSDQQAPIKKWRE